MHENRKEYRGSSHGMFYKFMQTFAQRDKKTCVREGRYLPLFKQSVSPIPVSRVIVEVMWILSLFLTYINAII
jgi:hypothetical protein